MADLPQSPKFGAARPRKRSLSLSLSSDDRGDYGSDGDSKDGQKNLNVQSVLSSDTSRPCFAKYSRTSPTEQSSDSANAPPTSYTCSLPPLCSAKPMFFPTSTALDSHYQKHHAHICSVNSCKKVFPDELFLDLHLREFHDPIVALQRESGKKTYACFSQTCTRKFSTSQKRKHHLVDGHKYPEEFFFALPKYGLQNLYRHFGESVSLIIPSKSVSAPRHRSYSPSIKTNCRSALMETEVLTDATLPAQSNVVSASSTKSPETTETSHEDDPSSALSEKMEKLGFIPTSVRFGRGKGKRFASKR